jgi:Fur family transcriptional regulator, ferric uptake regulator
MKGGASKMVVNNNHYHETEMKPIPRMTSQRRIIMEELMKLKSHPTANDLYEIVRRRMPNISLGTVYRNLEFLADLGMVLKLEIAGTQKRFDGNTQNHYHVRCIKCGRVDDVDFDPMSEMNEAVAGISEYEILWHRLEFIGTCPTCRNMEIGVC